MNIAAARLLEAGHIPFIGINVSVPVVEQSKIADKYEAVMRMSLALIEKCDALLMTGESPGANRERDLMLSLGRPVYYNIEDVPPA